MIYKQCSRCRAKLPTGTVCECRKFRHKEYDKYYRDKESRAFYGSSPWKRTRENILSMDDYIDTYTYMTEGKIVPAEAVHHIIPLKDDPTKAHEPSNLMSLSNGTHSFIETLYKKDKDKMIKVLSKMNRERRAML